MTSLSKEVPHNSKLTDSSPTDSEATVPGVEGCAQQLGRLDPGGGDLRLLETLSKGGGEEAHILCGQRWWRERSGDSSSRELGQHKEKCYTGHRGVKGWPCDAGPVPASVRGSAGPDS